jgi:ribosomal protein S18 acetylase RimI-like enzyme
MQAAVKLLVRLGAMSVTVTGPVGNQSANCMPILRALPHWFGIPSALDAYSRDIDALPTFVARRDSQACGFLTVKRHFPQSAEVLVMGVLPELHRRGVCRALMGAAERWLRGEGVIYLQVKTRGPSQPDEGYAQTRAFYVALGFTPLEEIPTLWNGANPALIMVKKLASD